MKLLATVFESTNPAPLAMTFAAAWTFLVIGMWYIG